MDSSKKENIKVVVAYLIIALGLVVVEYFFLNFSVYKIVDHFIMLTLIFNVLFIFKFVANRNRANINYPMLVCLFLFGLLTINDYLAAGYFDKTNIVILLFILAFIIFDYFQTVKAKKALEKAENQNDK